VHVLLTSRQGGLDVLIENDGGSGPRASKGTGYGLLGLRERVSIFGGRLDAGPLPEGGYRGLALLPVVSAQRINGAA
jgi:signal transduction histidine kinase